MVRALFEQLYRGFTNYWSRQGFELDKPRFPLVALVFADRESYLKHATPELGQAAESIIGYYNLATNRMTMYDITGVQSLRRPGDKRGSLGADRPDAVAAGSPAHSGHGDPRSHAPDRLQLRPANSPGRHSAVDQRGRRRVLRDARPQEPQGDGQSGAVNPTRLAAFRQYAPGGRPIRCGRWWPTTRGSATRGMRRTPTPRPGR